MKVINLSAEIKPPDKEAAALYVIYEFDVSFFVCLKDRMVVFNDE
ncbi:hypothetical protein [Bacillus subtilis]